MPTALIGLILIFLFVFLAVFLLLFNSLPSYVTETQKGIIFLFGIGSIFSVFSYVIFKD